ncbi:hypothetical protein SBRCBS47491_009145 [Sporothrix bragantina]|uniref:Protein kinase domain-containing protein n=1 Tax=Sporothrix bragantina TaxID=671064 RepID=A0ABP0CVE9_9PEZI
MSAETNASLPWVIDAPRHAYKHSQDRGAPGYSLQFVAIRQRDQKRWHLRVVVECRFLRAPTAHESSAALKELCRAIDFGTLDLLDDTLTEVFIHATGPSRESDVLSVLDCSSLAMAPTPTRRLVVWDQLQVVARLPALATYTVRLPGQEQLYVLKFIERELYIVQDTPALESELRVLERVGGEDHIVRLVAAVVSDNPYSSTPAGTVDGADADSKATSCSALRGLLVEYHWGGTLEALCTTVAALHEYGFTHMDIKPSNMFIGENGDLVLIDVGGAGGFTREWLSPHLQAVEENAEPLDAPLEDRKRNDMWAVGKP